MYHAERTTVILPFPWRRVLSAYAKNRLRRIRRSALREGGSPHFPVRVRARARPEAPRDAARRIRRPSMSPLARAARRC